MGNKFYPEQIRVSSYLSVEQPGKSLHRLHINRFLAAFGVKKSIQILIIVDLSLFCQKKDDTTKRKDIRVVNNILEPQSNKLGIIQKELSVHTINNNLIQSATIINKFKNNNSQQNIMKKQLQPRDQENNRKKMDVQSSDQSQCDDSYVPRCMNSRRRKVPQKTQSNQDENANSFNNSLWKLDENVAYMNFLAENSHLFESNWHQRKSLKINVMMSGIVKSRSPAQCRSHHQKMMKYHQSIPKIIDHILTLQKTSPKIPTQTQSQNMVLTPQTQVLLQDLTDKWGWVNEYEDLWNKMMDQRWLEGTQEYFTIK